MKIAGIIAEYNPLHRGHAFHIQKTRQLTGADYVIVVMSGSFVQRGAPALLSKQLRAEMALRCGADAVAELPVEYSCASAEGFAYGAIALLTQLGADYVSFGSEDGRIFPFTVISSIVEEEPCMYKSLLRQNLRLGYSFPKARSMALTEYLSAALHSENGALQEKPFSSDRELRAFLSSPNNILGLEYCKAICRLKSPLIPVTVKREGGGYHDKNLCDGFSSASAIREHLKSGRRTSELKSQLPKEAFELFAEAVRERECVYTDDLSLLLKYALLRENRQSILKYQDMNPELANRIYRQLGEFESFSQFALLLKTKELTYSRIQRSLLHVLLGMEWRKNSDFGKEWEGNAEDAFVHRKNRFSRPEYIRILGMRRSSGEVLSYAKNHSPLPVIIKPARAEKRLSGEAARMFQRDIFASQLWESVAADKAGRKGVHEYQKKFIIV